MQGIASEPLLQPAVFVSPDEVHRLLDELAVKREAQIWSPELCLMAMTSYVLLLQGALSDARQTISYSGALPEISEAIREPLCLSMMEADASLVLLLTHEYLRRDRLRFRFPKLREHLRPRDYFWRLGTRETRRRRQLCRTLSERLLGALPAALASYSDWRTSFSWMPDNFYEIRGSWDAWERRPLRAEERWP